jgi:outer membrane biosynthesis protein TonB
VTTVAIPRRPSTPRRQFDDSAWIGLAVSLLLHLGLALAIVIGLLRVAYEPPPPPVPVEVDIVSDDVGLTSTVPEPVPLPPAPRVTPEAGPPEEAAPPEPVKTPSPPVATPEPIPVPTPKPAPKPVAATPSPRPSPVAAPPKPAASRPAPARAPQTPPQRKPGIDRSLVAGLRDTPGAPTRTPSSAPARTVAPSAPVGPAQLAGLAAAIRRQVQPCADRIVSPGPGAERITTKLNLQMRADGSFAAAPRVVSQVTDADNARYGARVGELARAAFVQCAPFELPPALYDGWKNINLNYKLPE